MAQFFNATQQPLPEEGVVAQTLDLDVLSGVRTIVDKVNLEGVGRTKDVVLKRECQRIFQSENFEELVHNVDYTIKEFQRMGLFKAVGALIDVGKDANNYEVSFFVKEPSRLFGSIQTTVSGSGDTGLNVAVETPNVFGAGQKFRIEQGFGTKTKSHFTLSYGHPIQLSPLKYVNTSIFRRNFLLDASGLFNVDHGVGLDVQTELGPLTRHRVGWEGSWRYLNSLNPRTPYEVRQYAGHTLKSAVVNEIVHDTRDHAMLPEEGVLARFSNELAGLGGDVKHVKSEANFQVNLPIWRSIVAQASLGCGYIFPLGLGPVSIGDRYFLGGLNLRGFAQNHVGPHAGAFALGGSAYWNSGLHVYAPLPFGDPHQPLLRHIRLHTFFNMGNVASDAKDLPGLFHTFPASVGCGIVLALGKLARLEINFARVLRAKETEVQTGNFAFGFGVTYS
ncbi:Sorting and assembly machinery component 50-like protein B [Hypsibius exemplaris]|uniref:Sorting and assembly machinery component 50-like protein B n=1 Tax=Hypsibius exemplaris TaxID=2072580 RepID=A0A9X6NQG5_HYPEX|nr:Sorting and assembly machinery component 50-like protein B [Hypsibius exemplaris]